MTNLPTAIATVPLGLVWRFARAGLVSAFAMALVFPYAVVELARAGHPPMAVGLFALLQPAAMIAVLIALPQLHRRFGRVGSVRLGLACGFVALGLFAGTSSYPLWCLAALFAGVQLAILWTTVDTAISENVPKARAGAVIGLYQTLLSGAIVAGPGLVGLGAIPFDLAVRIGLALLALAGLATLDRSVRALDGGAPADSAMIGLGAFLRANLPLAAAATLAGVFEMGTGAMASIQALHLGFAAASAVLVAAVIALGSLLAQFPIGRLSDRFGAANLMRASGIILLLTGLALPLSELEPRLLWLLAGLWGAFGGALQTLVYIHIARTKRGRDVALGMVTMALGFTLGSLIGPGLGGIVVELSSEYGLAFLLCLLSLGVLALLGPTAAQGASGSA